MFRIFSDHGTIAEMAENGATIFVPTKQDSTHILGRTGFHSDNFDFLHFCWIPDSQICRFKAVSWHVS